MSTLESRRAAPVVEIRFPPKFVSIFQPARYHVYYGGRGSSKSHSVARFLILQALQRPVRILCAREFQNSIADSVHRLLGDLIKEMGLAAYFDIQQRTITSCVGAQFIFAGLAHNIQSIKSMEGIDYCWIEEAECVSELSWDILIPTIRKNGSQIIITFNPRFETDPTYKRFVIQCPPDTVRAEVNWVDNPWFPDVLKREMEHCRAVDFERYEHIWMGKTRTYSDAQVFKGKYVVEDFDDSMFDDVIPRYGADWGFAADPAALVRCFVVGPDLYISHEAHGHGIDLDALPALWSTVPGVRQFKILADSARPETISHLCKPDHGGFWVEPAPKWSGCVEDGVSYIRQFRRVVIHPRCKNTLYEFGMYQYKIDKQTQEILPIIVDKHNHCVDALRYALSPLITQGVTIFDAGVVS